MTESRILRTTLFGVLRRSHWPFIHKLRIVYQGIILDFASHCNPINWRLAPGAGSAGLSHARTRSSVQRLVNPLQLPDSPFLVSPVDTSCCGFHWSAQKVTRPWCKCMQSRKPWRCRALLSKTCFIINFVGHGSWWFLIVVRRFLVFPGSRKAWYWNMLPHYQLIRFYKTSQSLHDWPWNGFCSPKLPLNTKNHQGTDELSDVLFLQHSSVLTFPATKRFACNIWKNSRCPASWIKKSGYAYFPVLRNSCACAKYANANSEVSARAVHLSAAVSNDEAVVTGKSVALHHCLQPNQTISIFGCNLVFSYLQMQLGGSSLTFCIQYDSINTS